MSATPSLFRAESFRTTKEWIYFCVEFGLDLCRGCHQRARRPSGEAPWFCTSCEPPLHTGLLRALETRENVSLTCELCGVATALRDSWISDDCLRVYCAAHLKPLRKEDRFRLTRRHLGVRVRSGPAVGLRDRLERLGRHEAEVDCESCSFNGHGIYDGDRLVEIDRGNRRCDSAPDTLNCAGLDH